MLCLKGKTVKSAGIIFLAKILLFINLNRFTRSIKYLNRLIVSRVKSFISKTMSNGSKSKDDEEIANLEAMLLEADEEDVTEEPKKKGLSNLFKPNNDDSSDDEDQRDFQSSKYNDFGREINKRLKESEESKRYEAIRLSAPTPSTSSGFLQQIPVLARKAEVANRIATPAEPAVFYDPVFGLRIVQPLVSSSTLKDRMEGKTAVTVQRVRFHTERGDMTKDWAIAGVLVTKSPVRQTQKGDPFSIWSLSDLKGDIKMVSVFMFRSAHKELWKTSVGTVVGILNPKTMERKDDKVEAVLSVDNHQKVMILGQSKDLGKCRSKKNNGEPCEAIINKTDCDVCIFHMKREYSKVKRSEFQSAGLGRGLDNLRNKVLGKSEVFYAGQSFAALKPAKKPAKMIKQDQDRLMSLSEYFTAPYRENSQSTSTGSPRLLASNQTQAPKRPGAAASLEIKVSQRKKDLERLKMLQGTETPQMIFSPKVQAAAAVTEPSKQANFVPKLSGDNLMFSLSIPVKKNELAKQRAAEILKKKPLEPSNPNHVKYRGTEAGKKRLVDDFCTSSNIDENDAKKIKLSEVEETKRRKEYLLKMMNATSSHADLVEDKEAERREKCFNAMEKKEAMEERMENTMEMKVI